MVRKSSHCIPGVKLASALPGSSAALTGLLVVGLSLAPPFGSVGLSQHTSPSIGQYRSDLKAFLKLSKSDQPEIVRVAIYNLCELHATLVGDPRHATDSQLQGFRVTAARRLERYQKDYRNEILRSRRRNGGASEEPVLSPEPPPHDVAQADAQQLLGDQLDAEELEIYESLADAHALSGQASGGPGQVFRFVGGQFGPPWDYGPQLVALIQTTVDPAYWESGGGQGVIQYYQPGQALVVSASSLVQDEVHTLLLMLRAAGG